MIDRHCGILSTFFVLALLCLPGKTSVFGQTSGPVDYDKIVYDLSLRLKAGRPDALRDLGTLLDRPEVRSRVTRILKNATFFTPEEFDFSASFSKADFLGFFYDHADTLKFSPVLQAFYLTPVERQSVVFKVRHPQKEDLTDPSSLLRELSKKAVNASDFGDDDQFLDIAARLHALGVEEAYQVLLSEMKAAKSNQARFRNPRHVYETMATYLVHYPTLETLHALLDLVEAGKLNARFADPLLAKMTNISVSRDGRYDELSARYQFWIDSLHSMDEMRRAGYDMVFNFRRNYFQYPVDYFGKILFESDDLPWIRYNALLDIVQTKHPRALFYIAALAWRNRHQTEPGDTFEFYANLLERLSDTKVAVEGESGLSATHNWAHDDLACRNFLKYWASRYPDYEWDDIRKSYMNKAEAIALQENYERLFRRLNSQNDSVAIQSFKLLTEGDPIEVLGLARKYKELLRNYNPALPSFKYKYLEQLVQLTSFCRRNGFRYKPPARLNYRLQKLAQARTPSERYRIENQIIQSLTPDEVTALEYWAILQEGNPDITFSAGRILDLFYSQNLDRIQSNDDYFRLYLKKAYLFKNIGAEGSCNMYLNKFDIGHNIDIGRLKKLAEVENDPDILAQIKSLIAKAAGQTEASLSDFLENPDFFLLRDIKELPPPNDDFRQKLMQAILRSDDPYHQKNWLLYLKEHAQTDQAPFLFACLRKGIQPYLVQSVLEKIFDHSFEGGLQDWQTYWKRDSARFAQWPRRFFQEKIDDLAQSETLTDKELNAVLTSPFFDLSFKDKCLEALSKIKPARNIRRLKIDGWLSVKEDLHWFDTLDLGYKYLDDIARFFDLSESPEKMVNWLLLKARNFPFEDRGSFYNNLFQKNWFFDFVTNGHIDPEVRTEIREALHTYLNESDFISEFEEKVTIRNIALLDQQGMTLEEKLLHTFRLDVDENSRKSIEEAIVARIAYDELPVIIPYFDNLIILKQYNFLNRDFGLPVFDLDNPDVRQELLALITEKPPFEVYEHYLEAFGVDFKTTDGALDFNKIFNILQFEIVMPFVGTGGAKRDYFTYGVIKLLELHFHTRLGFHEKLNENQTFYTFTASKRARAWMDYLLEHHYVTQPKTKTPSFNEMVRE